MSNQPQRRGFCPRVWTPMQSGDGLIVRVHAASSWLSGEQLVQLVALAEAHGSGLISVTRRANLELRGIRSEALPALQAGLCDAGLAADALQGEQRFVLHTTPWLGLDPACAPLSALLRALEQVVDSAAQSSNLHPKLAIALSGPEAALQPLAADLGVTLDPAQPELAWLDVGVSTRERLRLGLCPLARVPAWVADWLATLDAPGADHGQRVSAWIAQHGRAALEARTQPWLVPGADAAARPATQQAAGWLGFHAQPQPWFGAMLPFGAGDPAQWRALAALAAQHGDGSLRTHPARGLLLRGVSRAQADALSAALAGAGLCVSADDPLTRVVACAGAPACASAHGETRALARELAQLAAPRLTGSMRLHVSGCSKSCAHSGSAALVVVHTPDGPRLGRGCDTLQAAATPPLSPRALRAALSNSAQECATPAPDVALETDPHDPAS